MATVRRRPRHLWLALVAAVLACTTLAACGGADQTSSGVTSSPNTPPTTLPSAPPPTPSEADLTALLTQRFQGYMDAYVKASTLERDERLLLLIQWASEEEVMRLDPYYFDLAKTGKILTSSSAFVLHVVQEKSDTNTSFVVGCMDNRASRGKLIDAGKEFQIEKPDKSAWIIKFIKQNENWYVDGIDTENDQEAGKRCK